MTVDNFHYISFGWNWKDGHSINRERVSKHALVYKVYIKWCTIRITPVLCNYRYIHSRYFYASDIQYPVTNITKACIPATASFHRQSMGNLDDYFNSSLIPFPMCVCSKSFNKKAGTYFNFVAFFTQTLTAHFWAKS